MIIPSDREPVAITIQRCRDYLEKRFPTANIYTNETPNEPVCFQVFTPGGIGEGEGVWYVDDCREENNQ